jgi:hypothetical protein
MRDAADAPPISVVPSSKRKHSCRVPKVPRSPERSCLRNCPVCHRTWEWIPNPGADRIPGWWQLRI